MNKWLSLLGRLKPAESCKKLLFRPERIDFGSLRRVKPVSPIFGFERGTPIRRHYIERFLAKHAGDIRGRVLEVGDDSYTRRFGGEKVVKTDVLHVSQDCPNATIVSDLAHGDDIESDSFDCIILTQTLQCIYDTRAAVSTLHRITKHGGVVLASLPGITQISRYDMDRWGDLWRFTTLSARKLFEECFPPENVLVEAYGNVLVAIASLHGLAAEDLTRQELEFYEEDYQVLITVRAVKPTG